jgi:hypothetical protein
MSCGSDFPRRQRARRLEELHRDECRNGCEIEGNHGKKEATGGFVIAPHRPFAEREKDYFEANQTARELGSRAVFVQVVPNSGRYSRAKFTRAFREDGKRIDKTEPSDRISRPKFGVHASVAELDARVAQLVRARR